MATLTDAQMDTLAAKVAALLAPVVTASAPAASPIVADVLVKAPKGERMAATRKFNLANKVAGKFCAPCKAGFSFAKVTCPRCAAAI